MCAPRAQCLSVRPQRAGALVGPTRSPRASVRVPCSTTLKGTPGATGYAVPARSVHTHAIVNVSAPHACACFARTLCLLLRLPELGTLLWGEGGTLVSGVCSGVRRPPLNRPIYRPCHRGVSWVCAWSASSSKGMGVMMLAGRCGDRRGGMWRRKRRCWRGSMPCRMT